MAGAYYYALDVFVVVDGGGAVFWVGDYPLEVRVAGEVFEGGAAEGVAEEGFGEEDYQGWVGLLVLGYV